MSRRLKLIVAYDGAPFSGWQSQLNGNGIQDHLERAFKRIAGEAVRVHGAGRTDAGVHALAQCAHVDLAKKTLPAARWTNALNATLPPTIRILRCRYVWKSFHARFSAKGKVYRYRIWSGEVLPPFEYGRVWHVTAPLDVDLMKSAAALFVGRHDFAAFAANRGKTETNTVRTLHSIKLQQRTRLITLELTGDGFLYKMVRLIVGAVIGCGLGKVAPEEVGHRLGGDGKMSRITAPSSGLFLTRVRY
jgi:tRNA pseudouridine38-40 synthase